MEQKVLILTDHRSHYAENSLYGLSVALLQQPEVSDVFVASRGVEQNDGFFLYHHTTQLLGIEIDDSFHFQEDQLQFTKGEVYRDIAEFDMILLRLPPPLPNDFLDFLISLEANSRMINSPFGIKLTSSKAFLLNFPDHIPTSRICQSMEDILDFESNFPIVLKPLRNYSGNGVVKVSEGIVYYEEKEVSIESFLPNFKRQFELGGYLAMRYMRNVTKYGDKRVVVFNGEVLGAVLRMPQNGTWLCNASKGGTSHATQMGAQEYLIAEKVNRELRKLGVPFFGMDILVDDYGGAVLSEINTTSVGGLIQLAHYSGQPILTKLAKHLVNYAIRNAAHKSNLV